MALKHNRMRHVEKSQTDVSERSLDGYLSSGRTIHQNSNLKIRSAGDDAPINYEGLW